MFFLLSVIPTNLFVCSLCLLKGCQEEHPGQHVHCSLQCCSSLGHGPCWSQRRYSQTNQRGSGAWKILWTIDECYFWTHYQKHEGIILLSKIHFFNCFRMILCGFYREMRTWFWRLQTCATLRTNSRSKRNSGSSPKVILKLTLKESTLTTPKRTRRSTAWWRSSPTRKSKIFSQRVMDNSASFQLI